MVEVRLAPRAAADLATVRDYSERLYGADAANEYLRGFNQSFDRLSEYPEIGSIVAGIRSIIRSLRHRQHRILYRFDGLAITVVRVLHKAQNVRAFGEAG